MTSDATRQRTAITLLLVYLAVICAAGLNPRAISRGNEVAWLADPPGIRFDGHGLAYTESPGAQRSGDATTAFTLLVDLKLVATRSRRGFEHVVTLFSDTAESQLLMGQWRDSLVVTNGADYDYRQRRPRLSAMLDPTDGRWHLLAVAVDSAGTRLFVDGSEVAAMAERLLLPADDGNFRLLVGNSVHGNKGWRGQIRGIALLPDALTAIEIAALTERQQRTVSFDRLALEHPTLLFALNEGGGTRSVDLGSRTLALKFSPDRVIIAPEFFQLGFRDARWLDVVVNLIGFVPLGFLGVIVLELGGTATRATRLVVVVGSGMLLSGCIELAQAWMPMRSSSLLDLLLNTTGTLGGALMALLLSGRIDGLLRPERQDGS